MVFSRISTLTPLVVTIAVVISGCGFTQSAPKASGVAAGTVTVALSNGAAKPGGGPGVLESATIQSISLEISASDMDTIYTSIPSDTLEANVNVPAGENRTFTVTVVIADYNFNGSATGVNIAAGSSGTVTIDIPIDGTTYAVYTVAGTASGLSGSGLVLQDNSGDNLTVSSNGTFRFSTFRNSGYNYSVSVLTDPSSPNQTCVVTNPTGTIIAGPDLESVTVTCTTVQYAVGGSVSGLTGGTLVLQNDGGDDVSVTADGTFNFSTLIDDGSTYSVTVLTQPTGQTCTVSNGSGTMSGAAVTDVSVACVVGTLYTIGGTVSGATGALDLDMDNGATTDVLSAISNGAFTFPTAQLNGITYSVTTSSPTGQTCTVANGGGTISGANVTNVTITCVTTTQKSWGTPATIETGAYTASNGSAYVATGAGGHTFAVWAQNNGTNSSVFANNKTSSGSWQTSADDIRLGTDLFSNDPSASVDSSGNAMAVWSTYGTFSGIWITFYVTSNNPPWNPVEALISDPLYSAYYGHEAMFPDGNYIVIYNQLDSSGNTTVTERHTVSGILQPATAIGTPSTNTKSYLKVAVSSDGTAIAAWNENVGADWNIMASRFDGANWGASAPIETLTGNFTVPSVAMDSSGNGVVVWYEAVTPNIYSNQYLVGSGGWQTAGVISDTSESYVVVATVAMNASGNAIAVWGQFGATSGVYDIWANTFDGASWGMEERLETDNTGSAFTPWIAVDSSGNGMAVWNQNDGTRNNIQANFFDGANWGGAGLIETNDLGEAMYPRVAADPTTGNFTAVWTQDDGTGIYSDVYSNIYQ